jgi:16S rRNA A1518/A1519 N6-dimethyltransferase RsmA/KsgA/DIM1 with predicted DNA glycosylase/AP lyase activity
MSERHSFSLRRSQNFLHDPRLIERLADMAHIGPSDVVYDLGAGSGNLTVALARRARRVVAVERDAALVARLRRRLGHQANVVVHEADVRDHRLPRSEYLVFSNPPFDITASVMAALTTAPVPPREAFLVLQLEAAQRFIGRPRATVAALLIAPWFSLQTIHRFRRSDFSPAPSVDAVFVRLHKRGPPLVASDRAQLYRDFVVASFSVWRPTIGDSMSYLFGRRTGARLLRAGRIDPAVTPSQVTFPAWLRLYREFEAAPMDLRRRVIGSEAQLRRQQRRLRKLHRTRAPRDCLHRARHRVSPCYRPAARRRPR